MPDDERPATICFSGITVDFQNKQVILLGQEPTTTTDQILDLFWVLWKNAPNTVPYADIGRTLWSRADIDAGRIHTLVKRLRTLLGDPELIVTVQRTGYRLVLRTDQPAEGKPEPHLHRRPWFRNWRLAILIGLLFFVFLRVVYYFGIPRGTTVRIFNCDDECRLSLNGHELFRVGFGQDSGRRDVTQFLVAGDNEFKCSVINHTGAITYGFEVRRNGVLLTQQKCGTVHVIGCNDNQVVTPGATKDIVYTLRQERIGR